jgi:hypothetical protein
MFLCAGKLRRKIPADTGDLRMRSRYLSLFLLLATLSSAQLNTGQFGDIAKRLGLGNNLSDSKINAGLKQALQIGAENAVKSTGRKDGYFGNAAIKILMPKNLQSLEKGLRVVGYGPKIDDFVLSMNRSAEAAAPAARKIFVDAITSMTFDDARQILSGGDTAATDYFKRKTTPQLTAAFHPVVDKTMAENGVTRQYNALVGQYKTLPFARKQDLDITDYVVGKALDGLFYEVAQEERSIRKDPAKQTTQLLKDVFGRR